MHVALLRAFHTIPAAAAKPVGTAVALSAAFAQIAVFITDKTFGAFHAVPFLFYTASAPVTIITIAGLP